MAPIEKLSSVGLQNIQRDITTYNKANTVVNYGLTAYVAMTLFLMTTTISTSITIAVLGTYTIFAKSSERAMVVPLMLSVAGRVVFGSTVAIALAGVAAIGMTLNNRSMSLSRFGCGAIAVTLLGAVPLPIAAVSLLVFGSTLIVAFERRAKLASAVHPLEVFREEETLLPREGERSAVILGGERLEDGLSSRLGSYLFNTYAPVTDVPYASALDEGPQLPHAAVGRLVEKANDRVNIEVARESVQQAKKYALMAAVALIAGATIPTLVFIAFAATALRYEHYNMSLGFGSVAALRYMTGLNPTLILVSSAAVSAYSGKGKEALPVMISAIASTLIFNASLGLLFAGVALSVPYIGYCITQQERSERYVHAADALVQAKHPFIRKAGGRYVFIAPEQVGVRVPVRQQNGLLSRAFALLTGHRQQIAPIADI